MNRTRPFPPPSRPLLLAAALVLLPALAPDGAAAPRRCGQDAVEVGPACVDKYEASVWAVPAGNKGLLRKIQAGRVTLENLVAAGAEQLGAIPRDGCTGDDYGAGFPPNGNWTAPLYAISVAGVAPSTCLSWFQAEQACRLAGKRLPTNGEWQAAASGTPDPGAADDQTTTCATQSEFAVPTGSRSACRSSWGAYDMAGNVWEWVSEWINPALGCTTWIPEYGNDMACMGASAPLEPEGESTGGVPRELVEFNPNLPGAIIRGGNFAVGERNGIFAVFGAVNPHNLSRSTGFRCAR